MNGLQTFNFGTKPIRTGIGPDSESLWIAKDVCAALHISATHKAMLRVDRDDRYQVPVIDTMGRTQNMSAVNESGLYDLILGAEKAEAKAFRRWVTKEVLPSIRKTGSYGLPVATVPDRRPKLTGALLDRMDKKLGFKNSQEWMIATYPEMFGNLRHPLPPGPFEVETPHLPLRVEAPLMRLVQVES